MNNKSRAFSCPAHGLSCSAVAASTRHKTEVVSPIGAYLIMGHTANAARFFNLLHRFFMSAKCPQKHTSAAYTSIDYCSGKPAPGLQYAQLGPCPTRNSTHPATPQFRAYSTHNAAASYAATSAAPSAKCARKECCRRSLCPFTCGPIP